MNPHDDQGSGAPTMPRENAGARDFLAGVRTALADLPGDEVADMLDDVRAHLAELDTEARGSSPGTAGLSLAALTERLGAPAAYAAELRGAAGYPPPPPRARSGVATARLAVVGLVLATVAVPGTVLLGEAGLLLGVLGLLLAAPALVRCGPAMSAVAQLPEVRALARQTDSRSGGTADFVASLQPGWWVLRALAAALLVVVGVLGIPALDGAGVLAILLVALVGLPVSVWLGRRSRRDRRLLWLVVPLNGLAAIVLVAGLAGGIGGGGGAVPADPAPVSGLARDGEPVRDIRPYDADGRPLSGVYLFDQDGRPVDAVSDRCDDGPQEGSTVDPRPYPRGSARYDDLTGRCTIVPPAPLIVAVPNRAPGAPTSSVLPGPAASGVPAAPSTTAPPTR